MDELQPLSQLALGHVYDLLVLLQDLEVEVLLLETKGVEPLGLKRGYQLTSLQHVDQAYRRIRGKETTVVDGREALIV